MKTAADVILALEATPGRLDKEAIVQQAWDLGITNFFEGAVMAYDALRTFGVKKVPLIEDVDTSPSGPLFTWTNFKSLADKLENRILTGNAARTAMLDAAASADAHEWNGFYRRVLLKDLRCGVTDSTVNKILGKCGKAAEKYIIPVFSCQLAKPGEDHPKKMTGPKSYDCRS